MLTHETTNQAQSNMSEQAKTDEFQTKLTQLLITRNIGVRWNLTKSYINILNIFEVISQVLNEIKIWRLSWLWKNLECMLLKLSGDPLTLMLWVIVLLKDNAGGVFAIKSKAFLSSRILV